MQCMRRAGKLIAYQVWRTACHFQIDPFNKIEDQVWTYLPWSGPNLILVESVLRRMGAWTKPGHKIQTLS